jgi:hypothetical protein
LLGCAQTALFVVSFALEFCDDLFTGALHTRNLPRFRTMALNTRNLPRFRMMAFNTLNLPCFREGILFVCVGKAAEVSAFADA